MTILRRLLLTAVIALLVAPAPVVAQAQPIPVDREGWWALQPSDQVPAQVPSSVPATPPPPDNVPANALSVGITNGTQDKVAAVSVLLPPPRGSAVDSFILTMKESNSVGSSVNAASAAIVACPITSFWSAARGGSWENRPAADCDLVSAPGERNDGVWTFDLAEVAALWLDLEDPLEQNGVLLMATTDGSSTAQVTFADSTADGIEFAGSFGPAPPPTPAPTPEPVPATDFFDEPLPFEPFVPAPIAAPPVDEPEEEPAPAVLDTAPARVQGENIREPNLGNLPWGVWLLLPVVVGAAILLSMILGPAGDPEADIGRRGAVSRALARREQSHA